MALIRGFSKVDEDGKITIPELIQRWTQLALHCLIDFRVMRVKDTNRQPHIYFFRSDHPPYLSPMEVTMMEDTKYLDLHIRSRRKGAIAHSKTANSNRKASTVILSQPECFSCRMRHG